MNSPLFTDLIRLAGIVIVASLSGFALNAMRAAPLPLKYESAAVRLAAATTSAGQANAPRLISFEETRALLGRPDVVLLDARPAVFFRAGHLPGAVSLPRESFAKEFPGVRERLRGPGIAGIVIYCSGGDCEDSAGVAQKLTAEGIGPLAIFTGGWEEWVAREEAGVVEGK